MHRVQRSRFLESVIRSLLSENDRLTAAELARELQVTREDILPLLQTLFVDRCIACSQADGGVFYYLYSNPETAVLQALDVAEEAVPLRSIAADMPRPMIARALLALVQAGTVEVEASDGSEPRYRARPCALLE